MKSQHLPIPTSAELLKDSIQQILSQAAKILFVQTQNSDTQIGITIQTDPKIHNCRYNQIGKKKKTAAKTIQERKKNK